MKRQRATETQRPSSGTLPAPVPVPERGDVPPVIFVGGTGRSGTHIVARLLSRYVSLAMIPVECRFHVEEKGFPGLLAGTVTVEEFVRRLRGFWWKGFQTNRMRGLHRFVPRERFDAAIEDFEARYEGDPEDACRRLFWDLLWPQAEARKARGIVEQSCDTVAQAPTLVRLFPEARFVHVVRDGRDASGSRVMQTRRLIYPRTRRQGLDWWASRLRRIDAGARAIPAGRLFELALDDLLVSGRRGKLGELMLFVGARPGRRVKGFLRRKMSRDAANVGRWRRGLSRRGQREVDERYRRLLDGLESDGVTSAPLLRDLYEREAAAGGERS
jgi:hypothetical protein